MVDPLVDPAQKGRPNYIWAGRNLALLIRGPSPLQKPQPIDNRAIMSWCLYGIVLTTT